MIVDEQNELDSLDPKQIITDQYEWLINEIETKAEFALAWKRKHDLIPEEKLVFRKSRRSSFDLRDEFVRFSGEKEEFTDPCKVEHVYDISSISARFNPETTKVNRYLKTVRDEMIAELEKNRDETLAAYERSRSKPKQLDPTNATEEEIENLKRKLFAKKHCFILNVSSLSEAFRVAADEEAMHFQSYLFVLDFYLDRTTQEKLW